jgi:hypothetical protein
MPLNSQVSAISSNPTSKKNLKKSAKSLKNAS